MACLGVSYTFTRERKARHEYEARGDKSALSGDPTPSMSLNPAKSPNEINIYGDNVLIQAIHKRDGDRLTICHLGIFEAGRTVPWHFPRSGVVRNRYTG